jgi:hypothetical protein
MPNRKLEENLRELTDYELDQVSAGANGFTTTETSFTTNPNGHITNGNPSSPSQTETTTTLTYNKNGHLVPGQSSTTTA